MMHDKKKTMYVSFDSKFIRLDQKHVGLARQASPFLRYAWSCLINLISKDTYLVFYINEKSVCGIKEKNFFYHCHKHQNIRLTSSIKTLKRRRFQTIE